MFKNKKVQDPYIGVWQHKKNRDYFIIVVGIKPPNQYQIGSARVVCFGMFEKTFHTRHNTTTKLLDDLYNKIA